MFVRQTKAVEIEEAERYRTRRTRTSPRRSRCSTLVSKYTPQLRQAHWALLQILWQQWRSKTHCDGVSYSLFIYLTSAQYGGSVWLLTTHTTKHYNPNNKHTQDIACITHTHMYLKGCLRRMLVGPRTKRRGDRRSRKISNTKNLKETKEKPQKKKSASWVCASCGLVWIKISDVTCSKIHQSRKGRYPAGSMDNEHKDALAAGWPLDAGGCQSSHPADEKPRPRRGKLGVRAAGLSTSRRRLLCNACSSRPFTASKTTSVAQ
jgi:hypothetical protein